MSRLALSSNAIQEFCYGVPSKILPTYYSLVTLANENFGYKIGVCGWGGVGWGLGGWNPFHKLLANEEPWCFTVNVAVKPRPSAVADDKILLKTSEVVRTPTGDICGEKS